MLGPWRTRALYASSHFNSGGQPIAEQVTLGRGGAGDIGPPKSAAARRTISIPTELADELSAHMNALDLTGADPEELLFPNNEGRPVDYSNWRRRVWESAVEAAGLDGQLP